MHPGGGGDFATIQEAITAAQDEDVIELADGTFIGEGNRDISLLGKAITIRSQSGNRTVCIIDCEADFDHPHRGFLFESGEGVETVVDGVTITGGFVTASSPGHFGGGAIWCLGSAPTFRNCAFIANSGGANVLGGAVYCSENASPIFLSCLFQTNVADRGGGLFGEEGSTIECEDCEFTENDPSGLNCPEITCTDCTFSGNLRGGAACRSGTLTNCSFTQNMGAGLSGSGGLLTVSQCSFEDNSGSDEGGGIFQRGDLELTESTFFGNAADQLGGAVALWGYGRIRDCTFYDNGAGSGGAVYVRQSGEGDLLIERCTFMRNSAEGWGGGVRVEHDHTEIVNCTFYDNFARNGGGGAYFGQAGSLIRNSIIAFSSRGNALHCSDDQDVPTITCCNFYGNEGGDWVGCAILQGPQYGGPGNISEDPIFCEAEIDNFYLVEGSPCAPFSDPNDICDLLGAWEVDCPPPAVQWTSWGRLRTGFK